MQGVLFLEGFSECCVEFHLDKLLKLPWPAMEKYVIKFDRKSPKLMAEVLEQNSFDLVVVCAFVKDFNYQYDADKSL
jgi:hypothetical protein